MKTNFRTKDLQLVGKIASYNLIPLMPWKEIGKQLHLTRRGTEDLGYKALGKLVAGLWLLTGKKCNIQQSHGGRGYNRKT